METVQLAIHFFQETRLLTNKLTLAVQMPRRACGLILKISECLPRSPANTHEVAKMLQVSPPPGRSRKWFGQPYLSG